VELQFLQKQCLDKDEEVRELEQDLAASQQVYESQAKALDNLIKEWQAKERAIFVLSENILLLRAKNILPKASKKPRKGALKREIR
jgi:hypothetical protein